MNSITGMRNAERKHWINGSPVAARKISRSIINVLLAWSRMGASRHLDTVSDHLLRDIGIQRHMIKNALKHGRQKHGRQ